MSKVTGSGKASLPTQKPATCEGGGAKDLTSIKSPYAKEMGRSLVLPS
jgi:hypothetical protein